MTISASSICASPLSKTASQSKSRQLLQFTLDVGGEERTIVSGIRKFYDDPAALIGKKLVIIANHGAKEDPAASKVAA